MIEAVSKDNLKSVLPLIRQYQEFYKIVDISDAKNHEFFSQFGLSNPTGCQFLFKIDDTVAGFATVYFSYVSSIPAKVGVMSDLYTVPEHRGKGIGKALIKHCHDFALEQGAARLQWLTAPDNETAQTLYDSLNTNKSTWHIYTYKT